MSWPLPSLAERYVCYGKSYMSSVIQLTHSCGIVLESDQMQTISFSFKEREVFLLQ